MALCPFLMASSAVVDSPATSEVAETESVIMMKESTSISKLSTSVITLFSFSINTSTKEPASVMPNSDALSEFIIVPDTLVRVSARVLIKVAFT